jgi:hypothetical protein
MFTDADGDALRVGVISGPGRDKGSVAVDEATGAVTFTPASGFKKGVARFIVRAYEAASGGLEAGDAIINIRFGARRRQRLGGFGSRPAKRGAPLHPSRGKRLPEGRQLLNCACIKKPDQRPRRACDAMQ